MSQLLQMGLVLRGHLFFATMASNYAREHPGVVGAVVLSAALDWAAVTIATALVAEDDPAPQNGPGLVRSHALVRP